MTKKTRYKIEYAAIIIVLTLVNLVPYRLALVFGDIIGVLGFSLIRIRRKVTLDNLRKSFPGQYSEKQFRQIGSRAYRNIAKSMIEYGLFPSLRKKDLSRFLSIEGIENLDQLKASGKGAVMFTGHFGSWELMGAHIASSGYPIDYLVGHQHNDKVNDLMNRHRTMFGIGLIEMGVAARGVIKAVRDGRMVAMLSDQDAGSDGVIVNFLGRPASTPKGPAAFAIKTGAVLICGFIIREGFNQRIVLEPPMKFTPSGDKNEDIKRLTQAYTSILERYIRQYPDHWFWPHRRWKSTT